jgi:hypothetical protein
MEVQANDFVDWTPLQKSLENACSLLYTALIGDDLHVFNNDNIFNIDKNYSNSLRKPGLPLLLGYTQP